MKASCLEESTTWFQDSDSRNLLGSLLSAPPDNKGRRKKQLGLFSFASFQLADGCGKSAFTDVQLREIPALCIKLQKQRSDYDAKFVINEHTSASYSVKVLLTAIVNVM